MTIYVFLAWRGDIWGFHVQHVSDLGSTGLAVSSGGDRRPKECWGSQPLLNQACVLGAWLFGSQTVAHWHPSYVPCSFSVSSS